MADTRGDFTVPSAPMERPARPVGTKDPFDHVNFMRRRSPTSSERAAIENRVFAEAALEEAAAAPTGAMVALFPDPVIAKKLAQEDGEAQKELHVTLAFLGKAADLKDPEALHDVVRGWAASTPPLEGEVSGTGKFTEGPKPVTYASIDVPKLAAARQRLVDALEKSEHPANTEHGFTPHLTLAYDDRDVDLPKTKLKFDEVTLAIGPERTTFKLTGTD